MEKSLTMSLFDPMMTNFHRIGLAGLFMSLQQLGKSGGVEGGTWDLSDVGVTLRWGDKPKEFFEKLLSSSFRVSNDGLVDFAAHRSRGMGTAEKTLLQQALFETFLNHNKQNKVPKGTALAQVSVPIEGKNPVFSYKPLVKSFAHSEAVKDLFTGSGQTIKESIPIKKWLLPGAVQRHSEIASTCLEEPPERYLCLLFAPMACLYYRLSLLARDGKWDKRKRAAVVIPHITNLRTYADAFQRYLVSPMGRLSASGLADAGLSALLCLKAEESMDTLGITGFSVITYGKVPWDKNQTPRTGSIDFQDVRPETLDRFSLAWKCLGNRTLILQQKDPAAKGNGKGETLLARSVTSPVRGLISENISAGKPWYQGFSALFTSKELARRISYEREGLFAMVSEIVWDLSSEEKFVEAIHQAIRFRFGKLASQAKERNERPPFDREFERMRTGLMRAKNAQTLRAELADFFSRGGINPVLQEDWKQVLGIMVQPDWQKARDLALLGLASYKGKGVKELQEELRAETLSSEEEE